MLQLINDSSRVMETRDHFKNWTSLKGLKSRIYFKVMFGAVLILLMCAGCSDDTPLPFDTPTGVTATLVGNEVTVSWNKVKGAREYHVYVTTTPRYLEAGGYVIGTSSAEIWITTTPWYEGDNYYWVRASHPDYPERISGISDYAHVFYSIPED